MKYLGRALVAGLAALGMMMAGAVTANAFEYKPDDPDFPTKNEWLSASQDSITKDGIDKLTVTQKVFAGEGQYTVVTAIGVFPIPAQSADDAAFEYCAKNLGANGSCADSNWEDPQPGQMFNDWDFPELDRRMDGPVDTMVTQPLPEKLRAVIARMYDNPRISGVLFNAASDVADENGGVSFKERYLAVPFDRTVPGSPSTPSTPSTPGSFSDVTDQTPHAADIRWLADQGISTGWKQPDGTTTFAPEADVNRQDMAAFLYRLAGNPAFDETKAKNPFADVTKDTPHYKEILWLASNKISSGYTTDGVTTFGGTAGVQRQDMAAFLHRLADLKQATAPSGEGKAFTDVTADTPHADDIAWLAKTGVSTGYGNGTFGVGETVIRQDMAAFLHRMSDNVLK